MLDYLLSLFFLLGPYHLCRCTFSRGNRFHRQACQPSKKKGRDIDQAGRPQPRPHHRWRVGEKYTYRSSRGRHTSWNVHSYALGDLEHKLSVLRPICDDIGRDPSTIVLSSEALMARAPTMPSLPLSASR